MKIYNRRNFNETPSSTFVLRCAPTFTALSLPFARSPNQNWFRIIDFWILTTVDGEFSNYYIENDRNVDSAAINYEPIILMEFRDCLAGTRSTKRLMTN